MTASHRSLTAGHCLPSLLALHWIGWTPMGPAKTQKLQNEAKKAFRISMGVQRSLVLPFRRRAMRQGAVRGLEADPPVLNSSGSTLPNGSRMSARVLDGNRIRDEIKA